MKQSNTSKNYFIYIATNKTNSVLYTGITNNLVRRMYEHKSKLVSSFCSKYNINKLVYFETFSTPLDAITREKQIKAGSRQRKINLISSMNPKYNDLYPQIL